jgi:transcriptional regulator with XRE-family HTH domain
MSADNHLSKEPNHPSISGTMVPESRATDEILHERRRQQSLGEASAVAILSDALRHEAAGKELGTFLRARRAAIRPNDRGFKDFGPRRVPGLRREEVASLAGVGLTWYTWLEQGRDIRASREMLQRVARAFELSPSDTAYLFSLAGQPPPEIRELSPGLDVTVQTIVDSYDAGPAYMMDEVFDTVAFNPLADLVYRINDYDGPRARNMAWRGFIDPRRRELHQPWPEYAAMMAGVFRARCAQRARHPGLEKLLDDLLASSPEFKKFWDESETTGPSSYRPVLLRMNLPGTGIVNFESVRMLIATNPDWLVSFHVPLDAQTAIAMQKLRSEANTTALSVARRNG